jgi:phosphoribosylformylglycinamidine synthase subunit PurQ / glutaminase
MSTPRVLVLRTAGTNCDQETAYAWELAGAIPRCVHVRELIDSPAALSDFAILTIPGGFSYGDDISAGKIMAMQLIHHLADPLQRFVESGRLVLGICNGFQVLAKAGLLPGFANDRQTGARPQAIAGSSIDSINNTSNAEKTKTERATGADGKSSAPEAVQTITLANNDSARFEARWIHLRASARPNAFLPGDRILAMPIAHGEGKVVTADEAVRRRLRDEGHIALTYCDAEGRPGPYPVNPNGSQDDIAGLVDATGRVLGLMPHPERHVHPTQHPEWTRRKAETGDGRILFETAVSHCQ